MTNCNLIKLSSLYRNDSPILRCLCAFFCYRENFDKANQKSPHILPRKAICPMITSPQGNCIEIFMRSKIKKYSEFICSYFLNFSDIFLCAVSQRRGSLHSICFCNVGSFVSEQPVDTKRLAFHFGHHPTKCLFYMWQEYNKTLGLTDLHR